MLNDRVRAGEYQAGVTVVEPHQVGRFPARSADLDDLARPLRLAHDVATHVEPVPDGCLHRPTSLPAAPRYPCVGGNAHGVPHRHGQYVPRRRWLVLALCVGHRATSGIVSTLLPGAAGLPGTATPPRCTL